MIFVADREHAGNAASAGAPSRTDVPAADAQIAIAADHLIGPLPTRAGFKAAAAQALVRNAGSQLMACAARFAHPTRVARLRRRQP